MGYVYLEEINSQELSWEICLKKANRSSRRKALRDTAPRTVSAESEGFTQIKISGASPIPQGMAKPDQKGVQGERLPHRTILPLSLSRRKIVLVGYNYPRG